MMLNEIKCPNCGEIFKVDESNYAAIVKQVRDSEFKRDVEEQAELRIRNMKSQVQADQAELKRRNAEELAKQQRESDAAINELQNRISRLKAEKQMQEEAMQAKADAKQQEMQRIPAGFAPPSENVPITFSDSVPFCGISAMTSFDFFVQHP